MDGTKGKAWMRIVPQLLLVVALGVVAVPLAGRFVPGARPWLDRVGLLAPLVGAGLVPVAEAAREDQGGWQGGGGQGIGGKGGLR